jgi:anaerobic magnesium-protoporphyrin IX monomethyl ester cyclase
VQAQLGRKQNWTDSDDLCTIFTAAYTDEFYHALRDALHAEVSEWHTPANSSTASCASELFWSRVIEMEPLSRNPDVLSIPPEPFTEAPTTAFMPLEALVRTGGV